MERPPVVHELKTEAEFFEAAYWGMKRFECRKNDRDFRVNDILKLKETNEEGELTGRYLEVKVLYVLEDEQYGMRKGYAVMSISEPTQMSFQNPNELPEPQVLTDQWMPFNGNYKKHPYQIRTKEGKEYVWAWPNAGFFNLDGSNLEIKVEDVTHVKKPVGFHSE